MSLIFLLADGVRLDKSILVPPFFTVDVNSVCTVRPLKKLVRIFLPSLVPVSNSTTNKPLSRFSLDVLFLSQDNISGGMFLKSSELRYMSFLFHVKSGIKPINFSLLAHNPFMFQPIKLMASLVP